MTTFIALLRAVNVGGTGKLPMTELKAMCEQAGFNGVRTYIASGNVVFDSVSSAAQVKATLEKLLLEYAGKPVRVLVRTQAELAAALANNPFPHAPPNHTIVIFLDGAPPADTLATLGGRKNEEVILGEREIYVSYGDGIGQSKLKIRASDEGTGRNINTVAKLVEMAGAR